jgi:hypothetical protein
MLAGQARAAARQWVVEEATKTPGFEGAFFHGSINWLPDAARLSPTSDVDLMVVLAGKILPDKPGKFIYRDALLEVSYMPLDQLQSPEQILSLSHLAGSFRTPGIILDPTGRLSGLQAAVSKDYARRRWVYKRCEHARHKLLQNLAGLQEGQPFHDQVAAWLFAAGLMTHVLLAAGLKNPTVRRRYVAAQELLAEYGFSDYYSTLLELLGCARLSRERVEQQLAALGEVFDAARVVIKTPFFFASDISEIARPIAIEGSRELIEKGSHREAVFWLVATYSRCQKVLYYDAPPETQVRFTPAYQELLADLGIRSFSDLTRRGEQIKAALPGLWAVAEAIIEANPELED